MGYELYITSTGCVGTPQHIPPECLEIVDMTTGQYLVNRHRQLPCHLYTMYEKEQWRRTQEQFAPSGLVRIYDNPDQSPGARRYVADCPTRRPRDDTDWILHNHKADMKTYNQHFVYQVQRVTGRSQSASSSSDMNPAAAQLRPKGPMAVKLSLIHI